MNSPSEMVQYHALSLLYEIKQKDRLAVSKLVSQLTRGTLRYVWIGWMGRLADRYVLDGWIDAERLVVIVVLGSVSLWLLLLL